jgi:hypothetical protein
VHVAETEADIKAFNERHVQDTSVIYFVNLSSQQETGFWASLFSIFSTSTPESDETHLNDIAENNPVLKVDIGKELMAHSAEDYNVKTVPFIIAFHKGKEILREKPTSTTANRIDAKVAEIEQINLHTINPAITVHPERDASKINIKDDKKENDVHHHPKPLIVFPDSGHTSTNDPAESSIISSTPIMTLDKEDNANGLKQPTPVSTADQLTKYRQIANEVYEDPKKATQKYGPDAAKAAMDYYQKSQASSTTPTSSKIGRTRRVHYGGRSL